MRNTKTLYTGEFEVPKYDMRIAANVVEVSPMIRCLILKTAFWLDFLIAKSPNLKKVSKIKGNPSFSDGLNNRVNLLKK